MLHFSLRVTCPTDTAQSTTLRQTIRKHSVSCSAGQISSCLFRWFSLILPALFQLLPHRTLERMLWICARLFVQAVLSHRGFFFIKLFRKNLFQACHMPFEYSWELHSCALDLQDKRCTDVNLPDAGNSFSCVEVGSRTRNQA